MKITFVMPGIGISGGAKAIFEFANHLCDLGYTVSIIFPLIPIDFWSNWYNPRKLAGTIINIFTAIKNGVLLDWFDLKAELIRTLTLNQKYIPDADIIIATWWATAYTVNRYHKKKGLKFYLVQHHEIWGGPEKKVNDSYRLGLRNIVNSTWLQDILEKELHAPVTAKIIHAPDREQFYPQKHETEHRNTDLRILMPYREEEWKGLDDGIKAFQIVNKTFSNIHLVLFGVVKEEKVPVNAEYYYKPYGSELREIYNNCDIFVFPSRYEGFGMPPMEAMACRCAVVTTSVGGIPDYAIAEQTALVSPPGEPESLAKNIIRLIEDRQLLNKLSEAGYEYTKQFTWEKATQQLEKVFLDAIND